MTVREIETWCLYQTTNNTLSSQFKMFEKNFSDEIIFAMFYSCNKNIYLIIRKCDATMLFKVLLKLLHDIKLTNRHLKFSNWPQM